MLKYSRSKMCKERNIMRSLTMTILLSSLSLGVIQYLIVGLFSEVFLVFVFTLYFFIPLLVFAFPLQYVLNKKPKKFSFIYFFYYLFLSLLANLLIFYVFVSSVYPLTITRVELYFYAVVSAVVYWFWDSIFLNIKISR